MRVPRDIGGFDLARKDVADHLGMERDELARTLFEDWLLEIPGREGSRSPGVYPVFRRSAGWPGGVGYESRHPHQQDKPYRSGSSAGSHG